MEYKVKPAILAYSPDLALSLSVLLVDNFFHLRPIQHEFWRLLLKIDIHFYITRNSWVAFLIFSFLMLWFIQVIHQFSITHSLHIELHRFAFTTLYRTTLAMSTTCFWWTCRDCSANNRIACSRIVSPIEFGIRKWIRTFIITSSSLIIILGAFRLVEFEVLKTFNIIITTTSRISIINNQQLLWH